MLSNALSSSLSESSDRSVQLSQDQGKKCLYEATLFFFLLNLLELLTLGFPLALRAPPQRLD